MGQILAIGTSIDGACWSVWDRWAPGPVFTLHDSISTKEWVIKILMSYINNNEGSNIHYKSKGSVTEPIHAYEFVSTNRCMPGFFLQYFNQLARFDQKTTYDFGKKWNCTCRKAV